LKKTCQDWSLAGNAAAPPSKYNKAHFKVVAEGKERRRYPYFPNPPGSSLEG
jgi:hypothetical protein